MRIAFSTLLLIFLIVIMVFINKLDDVVLAYAKNRVIPYVLASDDVAVGCAMTEAFTPVILSISDQSPTSLQLAILLDFVSASCSEFKAWEQELRYLRASYANQVTEAQDARIMQKKLLNQAARKQLKAYSSLSLAFKLAAHSQCPEFTDSQAEFYWFIGMLSGLQAILNDLSSEGSAKVPMDIAYKVARGMACLDNQQWWGVPEAVQAAVWVSFSNNRPADLEPLKMLQQAVQVGLQRNMRIAQVLAAQVYIGLGDIAKVKNIIRNDANVRVHISTNPQFKFLDEFATLQLQAISDRLWTQATGKRTPIGGLGSFYDDPKRVVETVDINDLL